MAVPVQHGAHFEVLVADDDADVRELLAEFFAEKRLKVTSAHDGRAAIAELERSGGRYGLVVTDIGMPGADGFAVLTASHNANPHAYVAIMTGFASLETAVQAVRLGAQDYLTKPFSLGQIGIILDRAVARAAERERRHDHAAPLDGLASEVTAINRRLSAIEQTLAEAIAFIRSKS